MIEVSGCPMSQACIIPEPSLLSQLKGVKKTHISHTTKTQLDFQLRPQRSPPCICSSTNRCARSPTPLDWAACSMGSRFCICRRCTTSTHCRFHCRSRDLNLICRGSTHLTHMQSDEPVRAVPNLRLLAAWVVRMCMCDKHYHESLLRRLRLKSPQT